jgi:hypothetical protein
MLNKDATAIYGIILNIQTFEVFFIFEGFIPLHLLIQSFGAPSITTVFFLMFFITISYPLHVSANTGHLQVEYILVNGSIVV